MWEKISQLFKIKELRNKIIFVSAMLAIFRVAAAIPIPGVDVTKLRSFFEGNQFFGLLNIFSGGALSHLSVAMLGVGPYITATIILQLLTMISPAIKRLYYEEGEQGRQKFNQYSRYLTVPLALVQGYGLLVLFERQGILPQLTGCSLISSLGVITAGTIFLMWLGELISEKGIGNGISLIIFAGIVSRLPTDIGQALTTYTPSQIPTYVAFVALAIFIIGGVVIISEGQRKIPVSYAKRVRGGRVYGGVSSYLPLRVNQAGVIPIIFAISIMLFPQMISQLLSIIRIPAIAAFAKVLQNLFANGWVYGSLYFVLVMLFTFFYTLITFEPKSIAENLQKQGGFIPGIRPGNPTGEFLSRIINRVTLVGAFFLGVIAILPQIIKGATGIVAFSLGGTSLLIVVSVALETMKQIEAQLVMREYEGF